MKNKLLLTRGLTLVAIVVLMMMPGLGWGQILTFEFSALAGDEISATSNSNNANLTSATITRGAGLTAAANAQRFNATSWAITSIANAVSGNDYMQFMITPNSGYQFSVSSIVIQWQRSGTGNTAISLRSSVDSYATDLDAVKTVTDNTSTQTFTWTFAQANSSSAITYRLYSYAEATGGTGGPGDGTGNDIVVNGSVTAIGGIPTKLAITSINGGTSPSTGTPFNVVVQSQDGSSVPANVAADTYFTLSLAAGTGAFGGTLTGSIAAGSNSATVTGVTYNTAEAGVSLTATQTSGDILTPGTSSTFAVLGAADHLAFVNVPLYALVATNLNAFTVEARRADNTVDANYVSNITLVKASGAGNLSGTTVKAAVAGIATFNDLQIDAADIYTLTATSGALTSATSGNIEIVGAITAYRSKISGNWNNITTWEAYTGTQWINAFDYPVSASKDVTIRSGHLVTVPISYNLGTAKNLTIESGATLYANSSSGSCFVYVYGDILNDGTIGGATDVIGFDIEGTSCQLSGSGTFIASRIAKFTTTNATTNLIFNQNVTLTYTSASAAALRNGQAATTTLNITLNSGKQLTVSNAKIDLTGCTLTLKSGSSLLDFGAFLGMSGTNVTVERAIAGGEWHFISAPVSDAVSGLFTGKFLQKNTESTNAFTDIESVTEALTPAKGFALYNATDFTAQYTGTLNTGAIGSADNVTRSATGDFSGWNLVGNPYPSSIDWNASSGWTKTNLNNATYIHLNASNWASYVGGVGSNGGSQFIASGQGFFVNVASVGNGTLTMNNNIRVHNATPFYKSAVSNLVRLQVSGQGFTDEAIVRFAANATAGFDGDYDAYKLFGDVAKAAQLYTLGSTPLAINTMPETSTVPVGIHVGASGTYTIAATEINDFTKVTLEDTKTAVFTDLLTKSYTFSFVPGENEQRFVLHFGPLAVNETESSSANIYSYRQTVYVNMKDKQAGDIYIYNIAGQLVNAKMAAQGMNEIGLNHTGNYIVKVISRDNTVVRKVFIN